MNRGTTIGVVFGLLSLTALIYFLFLIRTDPSYSWAESYHSYSSQPYGTSITIELLEAYASNDFEIVKNNITENLTKRTDCAYLFVGEWPFYTEETLDSLIEFMVDGNTVMIATNEFPLPLYQAILTRFNRETSTYYTEEVSPEFYSYKNRSNWSLTLDHSPIDTTEYKFQYRIKDKNILHSWNYFNPAWTPAIPHQWHGNSYGNQHELLDIGVGDGNLLIFSNPVLLTNIYMVDSVQLPFIATMFSYLDRENIIWDEASKFPSQSHQQNDEAEGPLQFILSTPSLKSAWYTVLAALFLFILFRSKRVQQIIPLVEPNNNRSLEFVHTIGRMHYLRGDHLHLAEQQMRLWYAYIKNNYGLVPGEDEPIFVRNLAMKSGMDQESILRILDLWKKHADRLSLKESEMIEIYRNIQFFYKHCT